MPANASHRTRLDSWKEIAVYLNRDVTTVRRWEKREGLPVHRHRHGALGSVYAFTDEIDDWKVGRDHPARAESPAPRVETRSAIVGRERELNRLHAHLGQAVEGNRRTVFIAGELGIGKTALVHAFLETVRSDVWVLTGQCVEQYGRGEPYLPVVEGLERLIRDSRHSDALRVVEARAPSWFERRTGTSRAPRTRQAQGAAPPWSIAGELIDAIEALAAVTPLVVVLEDLHWSDASTVELIARLGRRPEHTRLLLIGTYRLAELVDSGSPLLRVCHELRAHFQADEIEVPLLTQDAIGQLIGRDRKWNDLPRTAARLRVWSGNPLFLMHLLQHLETSGRLRQRDGEWALDPEMSRQPFVPDRLRTLVEDHVDRLGPETRLLLEIASVAGDPFSATLLAHAAGQDVVAVERDFEDLCRRTHLVRQRGVVRFPDGLSSASYGFVHEFYRQVVYERIPGATVAELHRAIGGQLEAHFGDRIVEIASEVATHFDRGHDAPRAAGHYVSAAENALLRNADREAQIALSRAAELSVQLPSGADRDDVERRLRTHFDAVFERLARNIPWISLRAADEPPGPANESQPPSLLGSLLELSWIHTVSGDLQAAIEISDRAATIGDTHDQGAFEPVVQQALVRALLGEFESSRSLASNALTRADRNSIAPTHRGRAQCYLVLAWDAWCLGLYDESRQMVNRILSAVEDDEHPARAAELAPLLASLGDSRVQLAESAPSPAGTGAHAVCPLWSAGAVRGWLLLRRQAVPEGLRFLEDSSRGLRETGAHAGLPQTLIWLAEGLLLDRQIDRARAAAEEGLAVIRRTGARCWDPELYRLRGEALAMGTSGFGEPVTDRDRDAAEASFWAGITVARQQNARTLELRSTMSLARLLLKSGREEEARRTLAPVCEIFGDGVTTPDLRNARNLLS